MVKTRILAFGLCEDTELAVVYTMLGRDRRIIPARRAQGSEREAYRRAYPRSSRRGKTDWERVRSLTDKQIEDDLRSNPDVAPILDDQWFRTAKLIMPERKVPISMRIDREVLEWFKAQGARYQSRMNAVLKAYVNAHSGRVTGG